MRFTDDEPLECYQCDEVIYPGESYYVFHGKNYCSQECVGAAMLEEYYSEVQECYLMTKEDKEDEYGDMMYHMMKDEGAI